MVKKVSHSIGNIHSSRNPCRNPRIWWENESVKKNSISDHDLSYPLTGSCPVWCPVLQKTLKNQRPDGFSIQVSHFDHFLKENTGKIHRRPTITGMDSGRQDFDHGDSKKNHQSFESSCQNPKSKICSPELNTGRSETNEGSVFITRTFRAQCAEN